MALVFVAAETGFAASTTNPFTVNVAQSIAELPLSSGLTLRIIFFACAMAVSITYLLAYGRRIKADPSKSYVADLPENIEPDGAVDIPYQPYTPGSSW